MGKLLIANWKMNGSIALAKAYEKLLKIPKHVDFVVCPPLPYFQFFKHLSLGAQTCHHETHGAFTGDVSAPMIFECGGKYVIIGHSERKKFESIEEIKKKLHEAEKANLIPILCCGESLEDRSLGRHLEVLKTFLEAFTGHQPILAYEPIWAIGTGKVPTSFEILNTIELMRTFTKAPILYGGSVTATHVTDLLQCVDGLLVGKASLDVNELQAILHQIP